MDVKNLIQSTARHIRITELSAGDAYKRIGKRISYGEPELILGVVTDVVSTGDDVLVTVFELDAGYSSTERVKLTTLNVGEDQAVFPATVEEITEVLDKLNDRLDADVDHKRREFDRVVDQRDRAAALGQKIVNGELKALAYVEASEVESA